MGYLQEGTGNMVWNKPNREKTFTTNTGERGEDVKNSLTSDIDVRNLKFSVIVLVLSLIQYFLTKVPILPLEMVIYILFHFIL